MFSVGFLKPTSLPSDTNHFVSHIFINLMYSDLSSSYKQLKTAQFMELECSTIIVQFVYFVVHGLCNLALANVCFLE